MKLQSILSIAAIALTAASCIEDMPEPTSSMTEEYYNRHFVYNYGTLDTNHTWTYAHRAYATVNVPAELENTQSGLTVSIYTASPNDPDCRILARYPLQQTIVGFDYILGHKQVYVEITNSSDQVMYSANTEIDGNKMTIDVPSAMTAGAKSLAAGRMGGAPDDINGITWILAAEDIAYYSTFDFNDIVLGLSYVSGDSLMTVYPMACGTDLSAVVYIDNLELGEIHEMFGLEDTTPLNNQQFQGVGKPITVTVPTTYAVSESMGSFKVAVGEKSDPILPPTAGTVPQMLLLPHTWQWPVESVSIGVAYPDFHWWCSDISLHEWINKPEGDIVTRNW